MEKLTYLVNNFRDFLNNSFENIEAIFDILDWDSYSNFPEEWARVNFHLMVLKHIDLKKNEVILPYGCTSYIYSKCIKDDNTRYYRIACNLKNNNEANEYFFVSFTGLKNDRPYWKAPFDYVALETLDREIIHCPYSLIDNFFLLLIS